MASFYRGEGRVRRHGRVRRWEYATRKGTLRGMGYISPDAEYPDPYRLVSRHVLRRRAMRAMARGQ